VLKRQFKTKQCYDIAPILRSSAEYCVKRSHNSMSESILPKIHLTPLVLVEFQSINTVSHIWTLDWWCEKKNIKPTSADYEEKKLCHCSKKYGKAGWNPQIRSQYLRTQVLVP